MRGLISKCQEFKHVFSRPLIRSIQETPFKDQDKYNFNISDYSLITNNVDSLHRKGGVALYISDSLIHRAFPIDSEINAVAAEVVINYKTILVVSVYVPPDRHSFDSGIFAH